MVSKIGINCLRQSPEFVLSTTKINTKKVWIWGLTPPPLWTNSILSLFFFNEYLPKLWYCYQSLTTGNDESSQVYSIGWLHYSWKRILQGPNKAIFLLFCLTLTLWYRFIFNWHFSHFYHIKKPIRQDSALHTQLCCDFSSNNGNQHYIPTEQMFFGTF